MVAPGDDLELIEQLLARQPVEAMERLAHHFTPSALRRLRLAERDAKIRTLAVGQPGSGRKIARDVHKELRRYAAAGFRFERDRPPADPRRGGEMRRALVLNRGKVPSAPTIGRALAGLGGSNQGRQ